MANAILHVGFDFAWYHASTNITPWNMCGFPFHVSYHNWLLTLASHISLFYLAYYNSLYYLPALQANKAIISEVCSKNLLHKNYCIKNGTLFSTNSLGNDLVKCSSNRIYKLESYSCCAVIRHSGIAKVRKRHQFRRYKLTCNVSDFL